MKEVNYKFLTDLIDQFDERDGFLFLRENVTIWNRNRSK